MWAALAAIVAAALTFIGVRLDPEAGVSAFSASLATLEELLTRTIEGRMYVDKLVRGIKIIKRLSYGWIMIAQLPSEAKKLLRGSSP